MATNLIEDLAGLALTNLEKMGINILEKLSFLFFSFLLSMKLLRDGTLPPELKPVKPQQIKSRFCV